MRGMKDLSLQSSAGTDKGVSPKGLLMRLVVHFKKNCIRYLASVMVLATVMTTVSGCALYDQFEETISILKKGGPGADDPFADHAVSFDDPASDLTISIDEPYSVPPLPAVNIEPEVSEQVIDIDDPQASAIEIEEDAPASADAMSEISLDETLKAERYYAYHTLKDDEKKVYKLIYTSLNTFEGKTPMPTKDPKVIDNVFSCVLADNPELFYVKGYNLIRYERGGIVEKLYLTGLFTMTKEDAAIHRKRADEYVDKCLAGAPQGTDDYEKIKYLYEYIVKNTEYDLNAENSQNFLSVFENGRSVCQGYATAMQYMMNRLGMFCIVVRGVTNTNENHAWNFVKADGDYYYVDVTWGDTSYDVMVDKRMSSMPVLPEISYEYLCVTTKDIEPTHKLDNYFTLPECTARKDYYFVREGNYFEAVDDEHLRRVFDKAYADGEAMVTVKCSDPAVYQQMRDHLTGDGRIFDFLRGSSRANYLYLDNLNELIFYL